MKNNWLWHILHCMVFVFVVSMLVTEFLTKIKILEPITDSVLDWDFSDFAYSDYQPETVKQDSNVVVINIGDLDRAGIAMLVEKLNNYNPKVIALNVLFKDERSVGGDFLLQSAFSNVNNLVLIAASNHTSHPKFLPGASIGFSNINFEKMGVVRSFDTQTQIDGQKYIPFGVEAAGKLSPEAKDKFLRRKNKKEIIRYTGRTERFKVLNYDAEDFNIIKDKIVLLGYVGNVNDLCLEEMYFTPLKEEILGKVIPDTHGTIIHANIIAMILNKDYVNRNEAANSLIIFFIFFICMACFDIIFRLYPDNFGLATRVISLLTIAALILICVYFYKSWNYKLDISFAVLFLLFAPDCCEFYFRKFQQRIDRFSRSEKKVFFYPFVFLIVVSLIIDQVTLRLSSINSFIFLIPFYAMVLYFVVLGVYIYFVRKKHP